MTKSKRGAFIRSNSSWSGVFHRKTRLDQHKKQHHNFDELVEVAYLQLHVVIANILYTVATTNNVIV